MLRTLAWVLVVWGVAVWATWGSYLLMGITTPEKVVSAGVGGGILVAVGYWLERKTRRKPSDQQAEGTPPPGRTEPGAPADRPRE
jgi:hypothetical protein